MSETDDRSGAQDQPGLPPALADPALGDRSKLPPGKERDLFYVVLIAGFSFINFFYFVFLWRVVLSTDWRAFLSELFSVEFGSIREKLNIITMISLCIVMALNCAHLIRLWTRRQKTGPTGGSEDYRASDTPTEAEKCAEQRFCENMKHENDLISSRISWLLQAETLLFASFGLAVSGESRLGDPGAAAHIFSLVGMLVAGSAMIVLDGADRALVKMTTVERPERYMGDLGGFWWSLWAWIAPWRLFPPMFIIAWYLVSQLPFGSLGDGGPSGGPEAGVVARAASAPVRDAQGQ